MSKSDDRVVDLEDLAAKNSNVDIGKLYEAERAVKKLRALGVADRGFALAPPFRRQVATSTTPTPRMRRSRGQTSGPR